MVKKIIHAESFFVFMGLLFVYQMNHFNWLFFVLFLLSPDLSALGYLSNKRTGATIYNAFHTYIGPFLTLILFVVFGYDLLLMISIIWSAHIAMDRTIGYGLKYPSQSDNTHLQKM